MFICWRKGREQLLPDCRSLCFLIRIGSDQIGLIGLAIAQKMKKTNKREKKTWSALEGSEHKLSHFNGPFSMCSILILFALPRPVARLALCRIWGSVFDFSTRRITNQKKPNQKIENKTNYTHFNWAQAKQSMNTIHIHILVFFLFLLENFFIPSSHCKSHCININKAKRQRLKRLGIAT